MKRLRTVCGNAAATKSVVRRVKGVTPPPTFRPLPPTGWLLAADFLVAPGKLNYFLSCLSRPYNMNFTRLAVSCIP